MDDRYLTDLADVCRRTGYPVIEVDDWQHRARGSGGYDPGRPNHVIAHHTASPPSSDGWPDVEYCTFDDDDAPLCNLYIDRAGTIYVCAGGATNTNGSGQDPCGWTPDDSMNSHAVGIEAGNDGRGEPWPTAQLDAYTALCRQLCAAYDIPTGRIHAHFEWAPSRKTDPAGPDRYATGAQTWDMTAFRADCQEDDDDMSQAQYDAINARLDALTAAVNDRQATWNDPKVGNPGHENIPAAYLGDLWDAVADVRTQIADYQAVWNQPTVGNANHENIPAAYLGDLWDLLDRLVRKVGA